MYIRTTTKSKNCQVQQLVESVRTEKGPRQRLLLSLGRLNLPRGKWPRLVARIKVIVQGQQTLFAEDKDIERLAQKYASQFIEKHGLDDDTDDFQTVDVKSLQHHRVRSVGGEYLGVEMFKKLINSLLI